MRTVIFDLDGTLADTSADLIAAANTCFRDLGLGAPLDAKADASTAFRGARAMLRLGFERLDVPEIDARIEEEFSKLLLHYEAGIDTHTRFYPGAMNAVEALRMRGFAVGICTNKPEGLADLLMTRLGARSAFASLIGADTLPVRKPDPAPFFAAVDGAGGSRDRSVLIGDTETDRETARAAGVPNVLVTFGPDGHDVVKLAPEALLHRFDDLPDLVEDLLGA